MKRHTLAAIFSWTLCALGALALMTQSGCDNGIDPDSLVRELRVLALRVTTGDPAAPGPTAADLQAQANPSATGFDLTFTTGSITLSGLVVQPTGPGRRLLTAPTLQHDFYLCIGIRSLYSPGTLDPDCRTFGPMDPDPKKNSSLVYLNPLGAMPMDGSAALTLPTDALKGIVSEFLQTALLASSQGSTQPDMGTGIMLPTRPLVILLPILLRSSVVGGDPADMLNSEVAYAYLRVVIAAPLLGIMLPPPNRNPLLGGPLDKNPVEASLQTGGMMQPLMPCPVAAATCTSFQLDSASSVFITGQAQEGSLETYVPLDDSGRPSVAETLRFSWFSSDGEFTELRTGIEQPQTQWSNGEKYPAPTGVKSVAIWLVLQDERGGADWQQYALQLP